MRGIILKKSLMAIPVILGIGGALLFFFIIPEMGHELINLYPEYGTLYWPYLIWAWVTAVPCYAVLFLFGNICMENNRDNFFCLQNSRRFRLIGRLMLADTGFFFLVSLIFFLFGVLHIGFVFGGLFVIIGGLAVSLLANAAAGWVKEGCALREENERLKIKEHFSRPSENG